MGGIGLTFHSIESLLEGGNVGGINVSIDVNRLIIRHLVRGHIRGVKVGTQGGQRARTMGVGRGRGIRWESKAAYGARTRFSSRLPSEILSYCKGNCAQSGGRKRHAGSATGRGSKVSLLRSSRLQLATYLAGDPKRKEWGSHCRSRSIYKSASLA